MILFSTIVFCIETLPQFQQMKSQQIEMETQPWISFEIACIVWFGFEYILRLISAPGKVNTRVLFFVMIEKDRSKKNIAGGIKAGMQESCNFYQFVYFWSPSEPSGPINSRCVRASGEDLEKRL